MTEIHQIPLGSGLQLRDGTGEIIATFDSNTRALNIHPSALFQLGGVTLTPSAAEINKLDGVSATAYPVVMESVLFTQTSGNGTYTGTISLPAGARIIDIGVDGQVLWNASTSASLIVGDGADNDGFFTATDLNATDLLAGEINNIQHPGGKAGAYIASEQRVLYQATARDVIGVIAQVGTGTAGRTRLYVVYAVATAANATKV